MDELKHYGTPRHSGRYPWGSGDDPYQKSKSFLGQVDELRKQGKSEVEIASYFGMTTSKLRAQKSLAKAEKRAADAAFAYRLKEKGYSNVAIGERMGINESSVRELLKPSLKERSEVTKATANMLKDSVDKNGFIDVGAGVEHHLGVSRTKLKTSIESLKDEGYTVHYLPVKQLGTGKNTTIMVLAKPGTSYKEVYDNRFDIKNVKEYTEDGGRTWLGLETPKNVNPKRIEVKYAEDGGKDKDGVIEIRRGVDDISLGNARYAQVRIAVDGTHYAKGMAMYADDLPDGIDIRINTNKHKGTPMLGEKDNTVLKNMKNDPDNPFGATVKQKHYIDKDGNEQLSALNIVNEEGDWGNWSKSLSSQMLSKQSPALAKKQLGLAFDSKQEEFDEIMSLDNPAVRKKMLDSFADDCDSSAVHLKAAALPRQGSHVILPFPDMKETEIYAPNYRDGEKVVLIRYPHGGKFEIPELTVNNKHAGANKTIHNAKDAVGIHPKVAERLSGADFDGDSVLVIPNNNRQIQTQSALKGLKDFDTKEAYPGYEGMKRMTKKGKQQEMGQASNLITDMTIKGAPPDEIARAVKYSMVVIDAEKHNLNYKQAFIDCGIADLKRTYQGGAKAGASTLISRASSDKRVDVRKELTNPKKMTPEQLAEYKQGKKVYQDTPETYTINGKTKKRTIKTTKMYETEDAYELSSGTVIESIYANHANKLKALGNAARKASRETEYLEYSPEAKKLYNNEVTSLKAKLSIALRNAPLERQAQLLANKTVAIKRAANPDMEADDLKKIKGQALTEARLRTGAKKHRVEITLKEWEAIQSGAISNNVLTQILNNTDLDRVKELATPRTRKTMTPSKISRAKSMLSRGYTQAQIADQLGVSIGTLREAIE